jgi:hypothetical protein
LSVTLKWYGFSREILREDNAVKVFLVNQPTEKSINIYVDQSSSAQDRVVLTNDPKDAVEAFIVCDKTRADRCVYIEAIPPKTASPTAEAVGRYFFDKAKPALNFVCVVLAVLFGSLAAFCILGLIAAYATSDTTSPAFAKVTMLSLLSVLIMASALVAKRALKGKKTTK